MDPLRLALTHYQDEPRRRWHRCDSSPDAARAAVWALVRQGRARHVGVGEVPAPEALPLPARCHPWHWIPASLPE